MGVSRSSWRRGAVALLDERSTDKVRVAIFSRRRDPPSRTSSWWFSPSPFGGRDLLGVAEPLRCAMCDVRLCLQRGAPSGGVFVGAAEPLRASLRTTRRLGRRCRDLLSVAEPLRGGDQSSDPCRRRCRDLRGAAEPLRPEGGVCPRSAFLSRDLRGAAEPLRPLDETLERVVAIFEAPRSRCDAHACGDRCRPRDVAIFEAPRSRCDGMVGGTPGEDVGGRDLRGAAEPLRVT